MQCFVTYKWKRNRTLHLLKALICFLDKTMTDQCDKFSYRVPAYFYWMSLLEQISLLLFLQGLLVLSSFWKISTAISSSTEEVKYSLLKVQRAHTHTHKCVCVYVYTLYNTLLSPTILHGLYLHAIPFIILFFEWASLLSKVFK